MVRAFDYWVHGRTVGGIVVALGLARSGRSVVLTDHAGAARPAPVEPASAVSLSERTRDDLARLGLVGAGDHVSLPDLRRLLWTAAARAGVAGDEECNPTLYFVSGALLLQRAGRVVAAGRAIYATPDDELTEPGALRCIESGHRHPTITFPASDDVEVRVLASIRLVADLTAAGRDDDLFAGSPLPRGARRHRANATSVA